MRNRKNVLLLAGTVLAFGIAGEAAAVEVEFTGSEKCPLTVIEDIAAYENYLGSAEQSGDTSGEENAAPVLQVELDSLEALGVVNDKYLAISYDSGKTGYVELEEISEKIPGLVTEELSSVSDWSDIGAGASGERTSTLQQALADMNLLDGTVDGAFGEGTASSVKEFQKSQGMEQTGIVDAFCWFRLMEETQGTEEESAVLTAAYPPVYRLEDKFRAIENDVEDVELLRRYLDPVWVFTYDAFEGVGRIDYTKDGVTVASISEGKYAADRLKMDVSFYVDVRRSDKNVVTVTPVIEIKTTGSQRPYIKDGLLKADYSVTTLEKTYQEGTVEGLDSTETTLLKLDLKAFDVVADAGDSEVTLRVEGMYKDYDFDVTEAANSLKDMLAEAYDITQKERHLVIEE